MQNNLGYAYPRSGRLEPAEAEYKYAIRLRPGHEDAYGGLGAVYELRGMSREAIEAYATAVEIRPDNTGAHMGLGRLMLYYKRDTAGALYWLREAQKRCTNQNMLERVNKIVDTIKEKAIAADYPDANEWPQRNQYK
ncbi:MAG: tetratricopeptide repeat protein [Planctomycetes bacterium]|nr:tetratricopeptide repeat protein [Planctomycetota bacterium]